MHQGIRLVKWDLAHHKEGQQRQSFSKLKNAVEDLLYCSMASRPERRIPLDIAHEYADGPRLEPHECKGLSLLDRLAGRGQTQLGVVIQSLRAEVRAVVQYEGWGGRPCAPRVGL